MGRIIFLLGFVAFASTILAQTPGTFTPTGTMTTARYGHTATRLPNGKVLIAGGFSGYGSNNTSLASAELYDPLTGTFNPTGDMTVARGYHTATLLPDGRVLIAGGGINASITATAELYDPSTGTFTVTGNMIAAQSGHRATLLGNGKVLIVGGISSFGFANPELYNPSTGTFAATGTYATGDPAGNGNGNFLATTATLVADGRVLIIWGNRAAELYDPVAGAFSRTGATTFARGASNTATLLTSARVLVAGGDFASGDQFFGPEEVYDSSAGTFTAIGHMTAPRYDHTATLLPNGNVLITGGSRDTLASAELYDSSRGAFVPASGMLAHRASHTATLLNDGSRVLITGGFSVSVYFSLVSAELYTPSLLVPAPILLSLSGDGQGQGAIQHAGTTRIASADDPAVAGEYLSIYLKGLADGSVIPPQVAIGGRLAEVTFFGKVPGYPGLNIVNIRMPSGVAPGPAVPVRLTYLGRSSNQVTIGVSDVALQRAIAAMKAAAGTDSLNFWQWAYYWQYLPAFSGAPAGFGMVSSISPDVIEQIISAGGGDPLRNISAEQWVVYFRQVIP